MTKRTRLFLFSTVGILVLGLGTGLLASYMGLQNYVILGSNGPDELAYVPANAQMVAFADIRTVMNSPLRNTLRQFEPNVRSPEALENETGINLERDVDYVVATSWRSPGNSSQDNTKNGDRPLLLARGRFDAPRIETAVRQHEGTVTDYRGTRVLAARGGEMAVAFIEPSLAAIGTLDAVRTAIDTGLNGAATVRGNDELMRLLRDVDDSTAWAVARFDSLTARAVPSELAKQLPPITWFTASTNVDTGVNGLIRAETRDEASAQNLREVIRGFVALAKLQASQQATFSELANSLELGGEGRTVSIGFSVPGEMVQALGELHQQRRREGQNGANRPGRRTVPGAPEL